MTHEETGGGSSGASPRSVVGTSQGSVLNRHGNARAEDSWFLRLRQWWRRRGPGGLASRLMAVTAPSTDRNTDPPRQSVSAGLTRRT